MRPRSRASAFIPTCQRAQRPGEHLVQGADGVDRLELVAVVVQQRRRLVAVHLHPVQDHLVGVVGPAARLEPRQQLVLGHPELQHRVDVGAAAFQHLVQRLGLLQRSGKPVQDETVGGVRLAEPVVDELVGQLRGHQVAGVQVALGLQPQLGPVLDVAAEQLTGGDLRDPELLGELLGLRPLARSRRPQQNDSHLRNPS
ncbi:hypothetical protein O980_23020 [Mycobacterium avium subsp. paratuberculosis 08-8281]|nr:hypothetical protein O980_23020 [Mycobacterium avium subsp. paratuberculosis 08-8281]